MFTFGVMKTKICTKCNEEKELSLFSKCRTTKDGLQYWCKNCKTTAKPKEILPEGRKRCTKCNKVKLVTEFTQLKTGSKDGYTSQCKNCIKKYQKQYYKNNKEEIKENVKQYKEEHEKELKEHAKQYYEDNKEEILEKNKQYREDNKEEIKENNKQYVKYHKDEIKEYKKQYAKDHKEELKEYKKQYYEDNKEELLEKAKEQREKPENKIKRNKRHKERMINDPLYKYSHAIRGTVFNSYRRGGWKKDSRTHGLLECSFEEFKEESENKFKPFMNHDNYGLYNGKPGHGWDFDHIIPTSFAKNKEGVDKLNHHTNFQPLCSYINRDVKRNTIDLTDPRTKKLYEEYREYLKEEIIEKYDKELLTI